MMKKIFYLLLCLFVLSCSSREILPQVASTTGIYIPLKDFFKNPEKSGFKVSPDGKIISFSQPYKNRMNIFVQNLNEQRMPVGNVKQITFVEDRDIGSYFWKENETLLFSKDFGGDENF